MLHPAVLVLVLGAFYFRSGDFFFLSTRTARKIMPLLNTYTTEAESVLQFMGVYTENKSIINMVLLGHYVYKASTQTFLFSYKLNHFYAGKTPGTNMLWIQRQADYK